MVGKKRVKAVANATPAADAKKRIAALEKQLAACTKQLKQTRASKFKLAIGKPQNLKGGQHCRVVIPDSHGCVIDPKAAAAFLNDLATINPAEVVMLGDHLECGGFLAQHHTLGYIAQTAYTFADDVIAANQFLDSIAANVSGPITYIEGNHERRIENWITTQTVKNKKDAVYLAEMFGVSQVLHLEKRGIRLIKQGRFYDGVKLPSTIRLGNCYFTHGSSTAQHAASVHVKKFGGNVVYGHTHRADSYIIRQVKAGTIGAWSPGCLCKLQPLWQHTNPTDWSHGYGLQMVRSNGEFLHVNVPIVDGKSLLSPLIAELK
jgi:predicted phosphodiesterase